jgi:hypothetical protein
MFTTAGAARATASAKLGSAAPWGVMVGVLTGMLCAGASADRLVGAAPKSAGLHQTKRNAAARPTITALKKKLMKTRALCN